MSEFQIHYFDGKSMKLIYIYAKDRDEIKRKLKLIDVLMSDVFSINEVKENIIPQIIG